VSRPVIDVHAHLAPDFEQVAAPEAVVVDRGGSLVIESHRIDVRGLYDANALAGSLAEHGIDAAWVSPPPPTYRQGLDADATAAWVEALDAGMRARIAGHPELGLLTYLPLDQPTVADAFVARSLETDPPVGWTASAGGQSRALDHADFEPLWERLEAAGRPLLLHPGETPDGRMGNHYLANLLGNPVESGVAAAELLLGGVLARHPGLKVLLVHCGGVVPSLIGRWARGVETARPGISPGTEDPRSGACRLWVDTLAHSPAVVDLALEVFGPDRLVLGSDYPFPMGVTDPFESIAHLGPELRERIALNAASLLPGV
jgi:aminocarboxymuconate-semialdehyde decarboxylase